MTPTRIIALASALASALAGAVLAGAGPLLAETAAGGASSVRVSHNVRLSADPPPARADDAIGLAVDPLDARHMVVVNHEYRSQRCLYRMTLDGGMTWRGGELRTPPTFRQPACDPRDGGGYPHLNNGLSFGSGQQVYTTFSARGADGNDKALVARSVDGGRSFEPGVVALADPVVRFTRPTLGVVRRAGGDVVTVTSWAVTPAAGKFIAAAVSTDGGSTFGGPFEVSAVQELGRDQSQPVNSATGAVHVAYKAHLGAGQTASLRVASSGDGGRTWRQQTLGPMTGISEPHITMAADPNDGTLYLTYQAMLQGDNDVWLQRSSDGALTWSRPVRVNDDPGRNGIDQCGPWVSVGDDGIVHLVWYDQRHAEPGAPTTGCVGNTVAGGTGNKREDLYYAFSTDHGTSFSANRRITDRTNNRNIGTNHDLGFYTSPVVVPSPGGGAVVAWLDSRDGNFDDDNQDVYLARVEFGPATSPQVEDVRAASVDDLSVALARRAYPGGREDTGGNAPVTRVVIVGEDNISLAAAAAPLARFHLGPILVSGSGGLAPAVQAEIRRLRPAGALIVGDVAATVRGQLGDSGVRDDQIAQLTGAGSAEVAAQVARALDRRTQAQKEQRQPAFSAAIIASSATGASGAAATLAAARQLPLLFVDQNAVPEATMAGLQALGIDRTLVLGDADQVGDAVLARLPSPRRLPGATTEQISDAVAAESLARGLPSNIVYLTDPAEPLHAALAGAMIGRVGGLLLVASPSEVAGPGRRVGSLGIASQVDRYVRISSTLGSTGGPAENGDDGALRRAPTGDSALPATGSPVRAPRAALLLAAGLAGLALARKPRARSTSAGAWGRQ